MLTNLDNPVASPPPLLPPLSVAMGGATIWLMAMLMTLGPVACLDTGRQATLGPRRRR